MSYPNSTVCETDVLGRPVIQRWKSSSMVLGGQSVALGGGVAAAVNSCLMEVLYSCRLID